MQRKFLGIINVNFNAAGQLLIIYFAFVRYLRKNGNAMTQCLRSLYVDFKKANDLHVHVAFSNKPLSGCVSEGRKINLHSCS